MIYYLFEYLDRMDVPGAGVMQYISVRSILAAITSGIISWYLGKKIIEKLRKYQIGETIRRLGLPGEESKEGTPTMGGIIIILGTLIPVFLFCRLNNPYVIMMVLVMLALGILGLADDWIKVVHKNKEGVSAKTKLIVQIVLGLFVALFFYFNEDVVVKVRKYGEGPLHIQTYEHQDVQYTTYSRYKWEATKEFLTTLPFIKNNEFNYKYLVSWITDSESALKILTLIVYGIIVAFIIGAVSNGANLTDGLDGLCLGTSIISIFTLAVFAYVSGNSILSGYLNIMYIPHSGELVVFLSALGFSCVGLLWYNFYPAQVFMGDVGSLVLGGIIAITAISLRKEILLPLICLVFLIETLSVIIQVLYFKYTKRKYGVGRRVFLMAPLHHHFQKKGWSEPKITVRFWIIGSLGALLSLILLKIR